MAAPGYKGATALAPMLLDQPEPQAAQPALWTSAPEAGTTGLAQATPGVASRTPLADARGSETLILSRDREGAVVRNHIGQDQAKLTQKVIPFTEIQRQAGIRTAPAAEAQTAAPSKTATRRGSRPIPAAQEYFDFVPTAAPRTLKDTVEAQVYCDLPVATPAHRLVAGLMDAAIILLGFGLFVAVVNFAGQVAGVDGIFGSGKVLLETLGAALASIAILYGTIFVVAQRETAGMKWSALQLVTFDGFHLDGKHRVGRFLATILSFCSGGLGLLWALADAENLTWHDQISRTFPTVRSRHASFVKQSRRR